MFKELKKISLEHSNKGEHGKEWGLRGREGQIVISLQDSGKEFNLYSYSKSLKQGNWYYPLIMIVENVQIAIPLLASKSSSFCQSSVTIRFLRFYKFFHFPLIQKKPEKEDNSTKKSVSSLYIELKLYWKYRQMV